MTIETILETILEIVALYLVDGMIFAFVMGMCTRYVVAKNYGEPGCRIMKTLKLKYNKKSLIIVDTILWPKAVWNICCDLLAEVEKRLEAQKKHINSEEKSTQKE